MLEEFDVLESVGLVSEEHVALIEDLSTKNTVHVLETPTEASPGNAVDVVFGT